MALSSEQRRNARIFGQELRRANASPRIAKALYAAGLVESSLRNLDYGDRDSIGILQERSHYGSRERRLNPRLAARRFISEAMAANRGFKGSAGDLAQAVQRSQFPERYDQRGAEADRLRARYVGGGGSSPGRTRGVAGEVLAAYGAVPELPAGSRGIADLVGLSQRPRVAASAPPEPAFSARAALKMPGGYQPIQSAPVAERPSIADALRGLVSEGDVGLTPTMTGGGVTNRGPGGSKGQGGGGRAPRGGLVGAAQSVDRLAARFGAPITARQEPGHAAGGDHDPAVRGATARDIGGSEVQRRRIFRRITRQLGVRDAVYKGPDINVVRGGVRYQIISRDHGTGPHLHIGMRRVRR